VAARDHAAIMAVLPADHVIVNRDSRGDKRACNHRHQTKLGMSRIRLYRTRKAGILAQAPQQRFDPSGRALSRKTES
jgi:hypothetical protein